jgi:hypothetical protein
VRSPSIAQTASFIAVLLKARRSRRRISRSNIAAASHMRGCRIGVANYWQAKAFLPAAAAAIALTDI